MYHRFPGRTALLAQVWLRTVERFQEGYSAAIGSAPDPRRAVRAAARHVVSWSRAHPQEASLLLYGAEEFGRADWSDEHKERADLGNQRVSGSLGSLAKALGAAGPQDLERITLALIDLPLSLVRRHLRAGQPLPPHALLRSVPKPGTEGSVAVAVGLAIHAGADLASQPPPRLDSV